MKKLVLIAIIFLAPAAYSQCVSTATDPCIQVNQSLIDRAARAADELLAARTALVKIEASQNADAVAIKAAATAIDTLQRAIDTGKSIQASQDQIIEMLKGVIKMQGEIIERMQNQLGKGRTAWQKLVHALEVVSYILAGAALSHGL
jgi:uncharacterized coiled-coil protein SlyX